MTRTSEKQTILSRPFDGFDSPRIMKVRDGTVAEVFENMAARVARGSGIVTLEPGETREVEGVRLQSIQHVNLPVTDLSRSRVFYVEVLGLEELKRPQFDAPGIWLRLGSQAIHLTVDTGEAVDQYNFHFAVEVDNLDGVVEEFKDHGLVVSQPPEVEGAGAQGFIRDPDGNVIEFNQSRSKVG